MPHFLHQVTYTNASWGALISHPQNRMEVVGKAVEKLGGKIISGYFTFGDYDVMVVTEMPDNVAAAGLSIALAGGGACKSVHTTPLLTTEESLQALKKASESGYQPVGKAA